jgi:mono/diheme cytochrome c family protein
MVQSPLAGKEAVSGEEPAGIGCRIWVMVVDTRAIFLPPSRLPGPPSSPPMCTIPVLLLGLALPAGVPKADRPVDYLRDVKPILAARCVNCHGAEKPRGKLRLDTAVAALKGGSVGEVIVPGQPEESLLYLAVIGEGNSERMPLQRPPLSEAQVETLRAWIEQGAEAPPGEVPSVAAVPTHWSFIAPKRPEPPAVQDETWIRNPIDRFILAPLERDGIAPSPEADRATLVRRASLDLLGLPPSSEEIDAFLKDDRPDAYERLVDRLLASPHYGERLGRLWLDGARYADSNGYSIDAPRSIWKYRDWVIDALNRDMPFDQFTIEQLAGDLLPEATLAQKVATGFHRNTPINEEGGIDVEQFRVESVLDRVNTTATVWLGLTMGCTQCHDHKFDPITQREYYQFFAFFNNVDEPVLPVATPDEIARHDAAEAQVEAYLNEIRENDPSLRDKQHAWEDGLDMVARQKQSQEVRAAFDVVFERRTEAQQGTVFAAFIDQDPGVKTHRKAIAKMRAKAPKVVTTMVVRERTTPRATHLLIQGDYTRPGDVVIPGVPGVLPPISAPKPDRLDLARWLVDPRNPLTARVEVNRLWQAAFGRGLVETENDFGTQGAPPSHPELLDWLATELVARGWSLKAIERLILTSATYRQASRLRPELVAIDPENRRLARQSRVRLDAELVRDAALTASGLLAPASGGPSVFPPQPDGVMTLGQMRREWTADTGADRYRRGLYTFFWRATPHPLLTVFDAPDATRSCTRRIRSNTPLQALTLLNDEAFFECARALAARVLEEAPPDDVGRLRHAVHLCLVRAPSPKELKRLGDLLARQRAEFQDDPETARTLVPAAVALTSAEVAERAAWTTVARVLLNLDEFITRE